MRQSITVNEGEDARTGLGINAGNVSEGLHKYIRELYCEQLLKGTLHYKKKWGHCTIVGLV